MSRQLLTRVLLLVGLVAVIVGACVVVVAHPQPASFGWFAYAPLSSTISITDGVHIISTGELVGAAVLAIGLIALAFWAGLRVGVRRPRGGG